ncbi:MAG: response regulator transcription factor [Anaerolineales bacterium]|nr:response regulator transcription factor [Anaerolineales bacterium]
MSQAIEEEREERSLSMPASRSEVGSEGTEPGAIRVMIADDHSVVVSGLKLTLEYQGFVVVAAAKSADQALERCLELEPDVLLLDIHMPHEEGFNVLERLTDADIRTEVIMLTASLRAEDRRRAIELGASGYMSKEILPDQLGDVVRSAVHGELEAGEVQIDIPPYQMESRPTSSREQLTDQELQVLRLIAAGKDNSEISEELFVTVNTVKTHVGNVLSKLGVENRTRAAIWAIRHGIEQEA